METGKLKKFAQWARRYLRDQVGNKLEQILETDSAETRMSRAVKELKDEVNKHGKEQVIEKVAYLWFNRFCAFRFMDANGYNRTAIVSPAEGMTLPEILQEAKQGYVNDEYSIDKAKLSALLAESKQDEAYRMLIVAACNHQSQIMPFMFEKIADYTELLMPVDLLSESSILHETREALTTDMCKDVEVIGWLYQFYISEKKDEVFADLKRNKKITPENIPAATQLFTPNWIVRYLVENSLGRLWMLNKPNSRLIDKMDYYIKPEAEEVGSGQKVEGSKKNAKNQQLTTDFLRISSPEELKVCDPACGSGHMLVYAFELLYTIYEEEGYDAPEIPGLILTNNLFGIELDERAGELAAFALTMKAREKYRRFFSKAVQPNICVLEKVDIPTDDLESYMAEIGIDLFTTPLINTIRQFKDADNFGSLIRPIEIDVGEVRKLLDGKGIEGNIFLAQTHKQVLKVLRMVKFLSPRYQVVVANPPYMGGKGMNTELSKFAKSDFPNSKSDLFAMFIERNLELAISKGSVGMITMHSWMFLSSYERLREDLLSNHTVLSMAHLGARGFDSIGGEVVQTTAFVLENEHRADHNGDYLRLVGGGSEAEKQSDFIENRISGKLKFAASSENFGKIPGSPIAYWVSDILRQNFASNILKDFGTCRNGMTTGDNGKFMRCWHEVSISLSSFNSISHDYARSSGKTWFPYSKGGEFRKWFGNNDYLINWRNEGFALKNNKPKTILRNPQYYFKYAVTWSLTSSSHFGARYRNFGGLFDVNGMSGFFDHLNGRVLALLNSKVSENVLKIINPTLAFQSGDIEKIPFNSNFDYSQIDLNSEELFHIGKEGWDSFENSWDFQLLPLIIAKESNSILVDIYTILRSQWKDATLEMQRLEEENNRIFIDAYGLQDELTPEVPLNEITLTCNPHYRYGGDKTEEQLEGLLLQDTIKEFISYSVGCMFGRYSLDKPGLILANAGETLGDYLEIVGREEVGSRQNDENAEGSIDEEKSKNGLLTPTFCPDADNVIPLMDVDWFEDDIAERFKSFLRLTFGEENYEENLLFVEDALGYKTTGKGKRLLIRDYFLKNFYADHVKMYKKRPIYWMFSSPKGTFNALIYMHRYRPDTISTVLNEYLREFSQKLTAHRDNKKHEVITAEGKVQIALEKEIATLGKQIEELTDYERDLFELASKSREELTIDLDDGVKVNYPKFGKVLKKIAGLS